MDIYFSNIFVLFIFLEFVGEKIHIYIFLYIFILDPAHRVFFHNNLLISHPFGLQSDASQHLKDLRTEEFPEHSTFTFSYKSGGGTEESHITDNDCIRYVEDNFWLEESDKSNVVIPHLEQLQQKSLNYQMAIRIYKMLSSKNNFLFTEVNLFHLLQQLGYSENDLNNQFNGNLKNRPNLLVLYPDGYAGVILITLPEKEESIHDLYLKADANTKAYQTLHRHRLIKKEKFLIISVVGAVFHEKSNTLSYCNSCNADNIITKEDIDDDLQSCWKKIQSLMKSLSKEPKIDYDINYTHENASLLALLNSITDDRFPTLFASEDERINKIALNEVQRNILLNPSKRKIIVGKYNFNIFINSVFIEFSPYVSHKIKNKLLALQ